jgi:hypothetical protein
MTKVFFENIDKIIISKLSEARFDIKIAVAWITDEKIIKTLEKCIEKNIKVKIIFYNDNINKIEKFKHLHKKGAIIRYTNNLMHNKFCIIDNERVINGSYNWTISAKSNKENIQITESFDIATDFEKEFNKILKNSISVDFIFADTEEAFKKYIETIGRPSKYPVFFKLDLDDKLKNNSFLINSNELNEIDYVYKLFYNEKEYIDFLNIIYTIHFTNNSNKNKASLNSSINVENKDYEVNHYGLTSSFIPIDIIKYSDIEKIKNITPEKILNDKFRMTLEKFIYFDELGKENILLIGFRKGQFDKINSKILIMSIKNTSEFNKIFKADFDEIFTTDQHIIFSRKVYNFSLKPNNEKISLDYRFYVNKENFLFDDSLSFSYNKNQEVIRKEIIRKNRIEEIEKNKKIQKYNSNECYIATMVYGDNNHKNIHKLREFRNNVLLHNFVGILFVKIYYKISPWLVLKLNRYKLVNKFIKLVIEKVILKLIILSKK